VKNFIQVYFFSERKSIYYISLSNVLGPKKNLGNRNKTEIICLIVIKLRLWSQSYHRGHHYRIGREIHNDS
jgi:hypothetical protein